MKRSLATILAVAASSVELVGLAQSVGPASADGAHGMGYVPSPRSHTLRARKMKSARHASPLNASADRADLPVRWDSREHGWVTPVKNQGGLGTCWAFSALATIETQFLKAGLGERDFSEKNMVNLSASYGDVNDGGNYDLASGYLLRWGGPIDETNDVYVGNIAGWTNNPSPALTAEAHVREIVWMPVLDGTAESRDVLKRAITNYGAVGTSMCFLTTRVKGCTHYCNTQQTANHGIAIVGWDDTIPTNAFWTPPPGEGAWLVKNSWGLGSGDQGFYYVSYYDIVFGTEQNAVFLLPEDGRRYDSVHGYDIAGPYYDTAWAGHATPAVDCDLQAVVFTAAWAERLEAIGFWTRLYPNPCEISVYTNVTRRADPPVESAVPFEFLPEASSSPIEGGVLACRQSTVFAHGGYATVVLDSPVTLAPGTSYAVVVRQTGEEVSTIVGGCQAVHSNAQFYADHEIARGNGYIGWTKQDGSVWWADAYDGGIYAQDMAGWTLCIRAYTCNTTISPSADMPGSAENGKAMLIDLAKDYPLLYSETFSVDALSALVGANGRSLWANWLAGFDPSNPTNAELTVAISLTNGVPCIDWTPNLGDRRAYTLWGLDVLDTSNEWLPVDLANPGATGARFFRITVNPR